MKVLIIGPSKGGGGSAKSKVYTKFIQSMGHIVDVIQIPGADLPSKLYYYYNRSTAFLNGHEKTHMKRLADKLEKLIKKAGYKAVISIETSNSYVLTKELDCLKIYSCESLEADELYFSKTCESLDRIRTYREMELEILKKSDYVLFPWKTTENYVRRYIWNGNNFVTIKYGCYPQKKIVSYFFPFSLVSVGSVHSYWSNRELLSSLTRSCPYAIDVYSKYRPPRKYKLNYKGFAPSLDILYNYQFGLNTVSKDVFRQSHFSSRPFSYLSYGLPVLSPDWMQLSHELKGVVPYNEENFDNIVEDYCDKDRWEKLSKEAYEQACELNWNIVLQPLAKLIDDE